MPRRKTDTRSPSGTGTIRKKTVIKNGRSYEYWEARLTVGRDPGTGKQIQRSFSGKTQKEVREKMQSAAVAVNENTYQDPSRLSLSDWLDSWLAEYLSNIKPRTFDSYRASIETHIKPALGATKLQSLKAPEIQKFYNELAKSGRTVSSRSKDGKAVLKHLPLSPKSIKNIHGVLHKALQQAVELGYIRANPSSACKLPRIKKVEMKILDNSGIATFLKAIQGHKFELLFIVTLFTGIREGEVLGLTWDCVDFEHGTITIKQQLQKERKGQGKYHLVSLKNEKLRRISPAPYVMDVLNARKQQQEIDRSNAGTLWNNHLNLVFTNEIGQNLSAQTLYLQFKKVVSSLGMPEVRFHDLRHSYAVAALQSGDDIKTVQENLGHYSAAFTLDVYGHVTDQMQKNSAQRMEQFIQTVVN